MVTPLMLLLSSINSEFGYDHPVDIMYLNRSDRTTILGEAERLGRVASISDENDARCLLLRKSVSGAAIVDNVQVINDQVVEISEVTAMLLTRLREAYKVFHASNLATVSDEPDNDLGTDAVILRLEGNPKYVYIYVYNMMENRSLDYNTKIGKLSEVYSAIIGHSQVSVSDDKLRFLMQRFELHSMEQFWERMVMTDLMRHGLYDGAVITSQDLLRAKQELKNLGFYGFVNPLKMYLDFSGARVNRKVEVNVSPEVISYLRKVVRSGGVNVA